MQPCVSQDPLRCRTELPERVCIGPRYTKGTATYIFPARLDRNPQPHWAVIPVEDATQQCMIKEAVDSIAHLPTAGSGLAAGIAGFELHSEVVEAR